MEYNNGYDIAPTITRNFPSYESLNDSQVMSHINPQPLQAHSNADNFQTSSISNTYNSDLQVSNTEVSSQSFSNLQKCFSASDESCSQQNQDLSSSKPVNGLNRISLSCISVDSENLYQDVVKRFRDWAVDFDVSYESANEMLSILRDTGLKVPKDVRTILREHKAIHSIVAIQNGSYLDLGIANMIKPHLIKQIKHIPDDVTINLSVHIVGVPLAKISNTQFWPILLSFLNLPHFLNKIFPIGAYHSFESKPGDVDEFLGPFLNEIKNLIARGIKIGNKKMNFKIVHILADTPAKAFLLKVQNHNGYFACNSCEVEGDLIDDKVCFLNLCAPLRTNESFRTKSNPEYHKDGSSPLIELNLDITTAVVLDYMHCVCQGVMKQLLGFWVREPNRDIISVYLLRIRQFVPSEFASLPRPLYDLENWKATELREFLLYTGIIVLKSNLKKETYVHFLLLFVSIRILCSDDMCHRYNNLALNLLKTFVQNYSSIYGPQFIDYNVHSLIHLPFFVNMHGSLDNFSAFKYDNYLRFLKKSMKCCKYPLSEIKNKIFATEGEELLNNSTDGDNLLKSFKINEKISNFSFIHYNEINLKSNNIFLSCCDPKDQCVILKNNDIVFIKSIFRLSKVDNVIKLSVIKILTVQDLFLKPIPSMNIGVYLINSNNVSNPYQILLSDVKFKCFFSQLLNNQAIVISLCHSV